MAKVNKNDIIKQYFSLLSKLIEVNKEITGREGIVPEEYKSTITKVFAVLLLLGYKYEEVGPNIILRYENESFRIEKESVSAFLKFDFFNANKEKVIVDITDNKESISVPEESDYAQLDQNPVKTKVAEIEPEPVKKIEKESDFSEPDEALKLSESEYEPDIITQEEAIIAPVEEVKEAHKALETGSTETPFVEEGKKQTTIVEENEKQLEDASLPEDRKDESENELDFTKSNIIVSDEVENEEGPAEENTDVKDIDCETTEISNESAESAFGDVNVSDIASTPNTENITDSSNNLEVTENKQEFVQENPVNEPNFLNKIFEADSSVIFVPGIKEESETWLDKVLQNLVKDNHDFKQHENFIYNRHIMKLKSNDGLEKIVKFTVYPLEYKNNKIPTSILVISDYYGRIKYSYSAKRKIVEITVDDMDFMVSGKWIDGEFDSLISPTSNVKEDSVVSDINKVHTKEVYPKHFGKRIKKENVTIDVFPVTNQNNKYGVVPSIAIMKEKNETKTFITGEENTLTIPTRGKLYVFDTYWMGDGFHVTEL